MSSINVSWAVYKAWEQISGWGVVATAAGLLTGTADWQYSPFQLDLNGRLRVLATLDWGEINVDNISMSTTGLVGKTSWGDFTTAYTAATQITVAGLPTSHASLIAEDIQAIVQFTAAWAVANTYSRDDVTISVITNVITVTGASFGGTDTFVVYTNIPRDLVVSISGDINVDATNIAGGTLIGKSAGGDFTSAYLWGATITIGAWPTFHSTIAIADIEVVQQINTGGTVVATYTRDDALMTLAANVLTVTGATFGASDTFRIYTNVSRQSIPGTAVMAQSNPITIATDDTQFGAIGEASDVDWNIHGQLRYIGEAVDGLEWTVPIPPYTHSSARDDFIATYTSTTSITIAGAPWTITNNMLSSILVTDTAGTTATRYVNGANGVTMSVSSNVITITGAGTPFTSGDTYDVCLNMFDKAYDSTLDVLKITEQSGIDKHYSSQSIADTTNVAADTNYYPSALGASMDWYKDLSFSGKMIDADWTMTLTLEVTNDEDTTNADWIQIDFFNNITGVAAAASSVTVTNDTITFACSADDANRRHYRYKMVNDGASNTLIIKERRKAL